MTSNITTKKQYASVRLDAKALYGHLQQALINNEEFVSFNCSQNTSDNPRAPAFASGGVAVWLEESKYD